MELLTAYLEKLNGFIWGVPMITILVGTHIYLTIKLKFIQKYTFKAIKLSVRPDKSKGTISGFGALAVSTAAAIGTGNIIGVATAISSGGSGAIFWMLFSSVLGISTKYAESLLAVVYREHRESGEYVGGPMYVLEKGLKKKWLAVIFAIGTLLSAFMMGNMVQSNSITDLMKSAYSVQPWISGIVLTSIVAFVIIGGIKSITRACEYILPLMGLIYILAGLVIIGLNYVHIPNVLIDIFKNAFTFKAAAGGAIGITIKEALRYGISRGLFSNESGLGSAAIASAAAKTHSSVKQGLIMSTSVFWDTIVVCSTTALIILTAGDLNSGLFGADLVHNAFNTIGNIGPLILTVSLIFFCFTTLIGWCYFGEKVIEYLEGHKSIKIYRWLFISTVMIGSTLSAKLVWQLADTALIFMAIPNIIGVLMLRKVIFKETDKYLKQELKDV
ncbi:MAG: sodium:alanine symporter family protein [Elusimicrobiaceae bacterium]|jgi:alanine or glycine:cation symporter, AGCS family|nr:sodium:alanine symporter family protein [Elusimicrobiaceae bacterium]MBT3954690.1 sodium:alanine symporter family protein [Elusimicrobiaceae bacterium]MBT4008048.1 sodium:alanine symporter family protein [Elusimicrobiaceae bacterium]MBT4402607.1 sodium:alanine symporter family protein [Elusimicrobiaceae bacterium]MBT4439362.1 sodium:alanine symporter family protein [Elusimicrobiaceae bacterium]